MKPIQFVLLTVLLCAALFAGSSANQIQDQKAQVALQAAIKTETIDGDLRSAIEQYKRIVSMQGAGRATVATALLRMGQCHEKLGDANTQEARKAYEQVAREYGDQAAQAQIARTRLAELTGPPSRTAGAEMNIRRIWSVSTGDIVESSSPDGRYLSIYDAESGGDLALWEIASGRKRRLTNKDRSTIESVLGSTWSPDSKKIAYCWLTKDYTGGLRIIGIDGSEPRILGPVWPLDWSPDGKSILAVVPKNNSNPEMLALVSVADGSMTTLGTAEKPIDSWSWDAGYSADGKYIVYDNRQQEGSPERDIFITSTDGKQGMPLVTHPADDQLLGWVPGSDTVLFASDRTGTMDAWALHVVDGKPRGEPVLVKKDIGQISPLGFTDEGAFFYSLEVNVVDIFEGSLDLAKGTVTAPPKKIPQSVVGTNLSPGWSPDGKSLAYVSERKGEASSQSSYILCIRSEQTGEEREIPLSIESFWKMQWAADSGAVFATMSDKKKQGLYKIDIQTGRQALLARSGWSESLIKDFAVSPDGKSVYYALFQWTKKLVTIIAYDLETGQEKEVYRKESPPDLGFMAVSPDGKYLSFTTADNMEKAMNRGFVIRIMPTEGGDTRDLLQGTLETFTKHAWTPDGKSILFINRTANTKDEKRELWQVDSAGGEPKKINLGMEPCEIRLHPDGRRIVFTSGIKAKEIWTMENFLPPAKAAK
jgi:Tol biopolymer transport system component